MSIEKRSKETHFKTYFHKLTLISSVTRAYLGNYANSTRQDVLCSSADKNDGCKQLNSHDLDFASAPLLRLGLLDLIQNYESLILLKLFSPDDCAARYLSINPGLTLLAAVTESRALIRHKTEDLSFFRSRSFF